MESCSGTSDADESFGFFGYHQLGRSVMAGDKQLCFWDAKVGSFFSVWVLSASGGWLLDCPDIDLFSRTVSTAMARPSRRWK